MVKTKKAFQLTSGDDLAPGDVCSIRSGESAFGAIKILLIDQHVIHVRKFKNRFPQRPYDINPASLSIGTINDPDGLGVAHLPVSAAGFASWMPARICRQEVTDEELEGYRCWLEDQNAVFD